MLVAYYHKFISEQERAMAAELKLKEAEVKRLRHQLSPHMVFNLLTSMDTVLLKNNVTEARALLGDLSLYLRDTLGQSEKTQCSLQEEIEQIKGYLRMEKRRFKDRLQVNYHLDPDLDAFLVPSLVLQPIIENCIKHGLEQYITGIEIEISTEKLGDKLNIRVRDRKMPGSPAPELNAQTSPGFGIGLNNTRQRLDLMYGPRALLQAGYIDELTFEASISIEGQGYGAV